MPLLQHFRRQFAYDAWANREVLVTLQKSSGATPRPRHLLAHILSAERLWFERIEGQPQTLPVWPDFSLDRCDAQILELTTLWHHYLAELSATNVSNHVTYKNSKGEPWTSTVEDVLTHVLFHSAYHRGQIASQIRAAGDQPAYTDFIHAVRQGLIE